jgi:hypothetical protein
MADDQEENLKVDRERRLVERKAQDELEALGGKVIVHKLASLLFTFSIISCSDQRCLLLNARLLLVLLHVPPLTVTHTPTVSTPQLGVQQRGHIFLFVS